MISYPARGRSARNKFERANAITNLHGATFLIYPIAINYFVYRSVVTCRSLHLSSSLSVLSTLCIFSKIACNRETSSLAFFSSIHFIFAGCFDDDGGGQQRGKSFRRMTEISGDDCARRNGRLAISRGPRATFNEARPPCRRVAEPLSRGVAAGTTAHILVCKNPVGLSNSVVNSYSE